MRYEVDFLLSLDKPSIVAELQRVASAAGEDECQREGTRSPRRVHYHTVVKRFGSLRKALEEAGLKPSRYTKATDSELLKQVGDLWAITLRDSGRRPRTSELERYGFPVGPALIIKRFGSWKKALVRTAQMLSGEVMSEPEEKVRRVHVPVQKRYLVTKRDMYTCQLCKRTGVPIEVDHIMPVSRGGSNRLDNLQTLCQDCNRGKGNRLPDE